MEEFRREKYKVKYFIILIYLLAFLFFGFKMLFYSEHVGRFPDEITHISYISYLEKSHEIIPNFKNMTILQEVKSIDSTTSAYTFGSNLNYLGHPPLYYQIMRLSGSIKIDNNSVIVNLVKLRHFNMIFSSLAIILILYIGYTRINKNPLLHCLYAVIVISVPMLAYDSAGINNDNLALLGLSVFVLGLLRFSEKNRNFSTYLIISLGVFLSFMSKLTTGLVVFISLLLYIVLLIIKEKNLWFLISKKAFFTLPIYILTAMYYIIVYFQTGTIMPTYKALDPQGYYASDFYVAVENRMHMDFVDYISYFSKNFLRSWTGIASHVSLIKEDSLLSINNIGLLALLIVPVILIFKVKKSTKKHSDVLALIAVYLGIVISIVIQCLRAYNEFTNVSGYLGGFQSRYYLCGISVIALAIVKIVSDFLKDEEKRSEINLNLESNLVIQHYSTKKVSNTRRLIIYSISLFFIFLLLYEDFIYFLINFKDYL
ncbi:hypothetical protein OSC52_01855 [Clostridium pasteurianum]|uniref:hypothetical protein n=1 Tax=Clostridium pasteurianum TaxID=1501 RepID=UPI002260F95D|nr:hypothetical protein [Clostridium pasteurianum]UZW14614.1 hypothetical protein OSC52_01855 [Clostridium pasteurianum]